MNQETPIKIAVASQNFRTVTPHAGRTRRFLVYEVASGRAPTEMERLDLPKELAMHEFRDGGAHPLDAVNVVIAASCGPGFAERMARRGIRVVTTTEPDPLQAVTAYLANPEQVAVPCAESAGHAHQHGHHHEHHHAHDHEHCEDHKQPG